MTDLKSPVIFTANRLNDGIVVWLGHNGQWHEDVARASVAQTVLQQAALRTAAEQADFDNLIVEPYEIEVSICADIVTPTKFRERIRATGPTIHAGPGNTPVTGVQTTQAAQGAQAAHAAHAA